MTRKTWTAAKTQQRGKGAMIFGHTLIAMKERGELDAGAGGDRKSQSQIATVKLEDLGLTKSQSSRYQQEASVPEEDYQAWVTEILSSATRELTASGLRKLAKKTEAIEVLPIGNAIRRAIEENLDERRGNPHGKVNCGQSTTIRETPETGEESREFAAKKAGLSSEPTAKKSSPIRLTFSERKSILTLAVENLCDRLGVVTQKPEILKCSPDRQ